MRQQRGIFTRKEMQAMPEVGERFKHHRSQLGWPKHGDRTAVWDMSVNDIQSNNPDECLPEHANIGNLNGGVGQYQVLATRIITCRLEYKKYTAGQANARYRELHAVPYDGRYVSGRYWVYWRKG